MTESSAGVETTNPSVTLPVLHPTRTRATRLSASSTCSMTIDRDAGRNPIFNETGEYGNKTTKRVRELQKDEGLDQTGSVGRETWRTVLERWLLWPEG